LLSFTISLILNSILKSSNGYGISEVVDDTPPYRSPEPQKKAQQHSYL